MWVNTRPTELGYYWYRDANYERLKVVEIWKPTNGPLYQLESDRFTALLTDVEGEWWSERIKQPDEQRSNVPKECGCSNCQDVCNGVTNEPIKPRYAPVRKRDIWFNEWRPIINAIGEISVQEAMDAIERDL